MCDAITTTRTSKPLTLRMQQTLRAGFSLAMVLAAKVTDVSIDKHEAQRAGRTVDAAQLEAEQADWQAEYDNECTAACAEVMAK